MQPNAISPVTQNSEAFPAFLLRPPPLKSLLPNIRPSGHSLGGILPARVILPAWPVWPGELVDAATGLAADFTVRCGMAAQSLLSWPLRQRLKDSSHVPPKGSGRTCWQSWANKTLLITDSARRGIHVHTHTLASANEDGAVEWSDKAILQHKWAYSLRKLAHSLESVHVLAVISLFVDLGPKARSQAPRAFIIEFVLTIMNVWYPRWILGTVFWGGALQKPLYLDHRAQRERFILCDFSHPQLISWKLNQLCPWGIGPLHHPPLECPIPNLFPIPVPNLCPFIAPNWSPGQRDWWMDGTMLRLCL